MLGSPHFILVTLNVKKNLQLITSVIIVTVVSLTYGLFPDNTLPHLFDFSVESIDLKQVFRATMGLYLSIVTLWITGIFKQYFWRTATLVNICFMVGLAAGRGIGLVLDGVPSVYFCCGLVLELILALWGISNLKRYPATMKE
jgi:hypothetical protein